MALLAASSRTQALAGTRAQRQGPLVWPSHGVVRPQARLLTKHQSHSSAAAFSSMLQHGPTEVDMQGSIPASIQDQQHQDKPWWKQVQNTLARALCLAGLAFSVVLLSADQALAARGTGGRVGGSSWSRAPSSSHSSGWHSSGSSYGGSSRTSTIPRTSNHYSASTTPRSVHHHTTVYHSAPSFGMGWGLPMFSAPVGVGPVAAGYSALSSFMTIVICIFIFAGIAAAMRARRHAAGTRDSYAYDAGATSAVTVAKLQVCLLGMARGLKAQLDALAYSADTSTQQGLHTVLQETILALLRHPDYCVYAASGSKTLRDAQSAERAFNGMAMEERSHVRQETLINQGGMGVRSARVAHASQYPNELLVVTLMVASDGQWSLPAIRSGQDLQAALTHLGAIGASDLKALELSWTPQAEGDTLTHQEVLQEYPGLVPI